MRIFNFVNVEKLIYMEQYNPLILNKIQKYKTTMLKDQKRRNYLYFQDVYCHVNKLVKILHHTY